MSISNTSDDRPAMLPGPARDALCEAVALLDRVAQDGTAMQRCHALAQVGRCYLQIGAPGAAQWYLEQSLRWAHQPGGVDVRLELLCELAELASHLAGLREGDDESPRGAHAARDEARDRCYEALSLVSHAADLQREVSVLLRVSDVLIACGDHDDAASLQARALNRLAQCPIASPKRGAPPTVM